MAKTANINLRVEPETKLLAEALYNNLGITLSDAINIFLKKSIAEGGLPFELKQKRYNYDTELAMDEARAIMAGEKSANGYTCFDDALRDILNDV